MAGFKNKFQIYGATPFETIEGKTIQERHMNLSRREYTPYCQYCGSEIIDANQNEVGQRVDPEWERLNQTHTKCYYEKMRSQG